MSYVNKLHLTVKKDKNGWYYMGKWKYRLQLCGNSSLDWFFIKQYADKLGKTEFMKDLTEILSTMEKDGKAPFTLYILADVINGRLD